ncbi:MAG: Hsp20/alpha crystallin family protein [Acidimicrobiia bacterium]|nr:Hsp20/alpha crystallin family protein [Acidimicrobiia bacterium]
MLLRFDPFREFDRVAAEVANPRTPAVPMDAVRRGDRVEIRFDLPGVDSESIDLEVERNVLTLRAERSWQRSEDEEILASERRHGTFTRQLFLGDTLDAGGVEADYADGVLTVTVPMAETAKARKVAVGHSGGAASISAESASSN